MGKKYPTDHVRPSMSLEEYKNPPNIRKVYLPNGEPIYLDENNMRVNTPGPTGLDRD